VPLFTHGSIVVYLVKRHGGDGCIHTDSTQHFENLPNIELQSPLLLSEQPQFVGVWTLLGVKRFPCWPILTPMLPTVVKHWLVDHS
jgi:hypothetical protein